MQRLLTNNVKSLLCLRNFSVGSSVLTVAFRVELVAPRQFVPTVAAVAETIAHVTLRDAPAVTARVLGHVTRAAWER